VSVIHVAFIACNCAFCTREAFVKIQMAPSWFDVFGTDATEYGGHIKKKKEEMKLPQLVIQLVTNIITCCYSLSRGTYFKGKTNRRVGPGFIDQALHEVLLRIPTAVSKLVPA
jgi:hypothetical protein